MGEKTFNYTSLFYTKCTIFSISDIRISQIGRSKQLSNEECCYEEVEKLEIDISLEDIEAPEQSMEAAGQEVSEFLNKTPNIVALHLRYLQRPFAGHLFQYFIKEIRNCNISVVKIYFNDQINCFYQDIPIVDSCKLFEGLKNLKLIQIVVIYGIFHSDIKDIIDAATCIGNITIEILQEYSFDAIKECLYKIRHINNISSKCLCRSKQSTLDIYHYIMEKKISLSIPRTKPNFFDFNEFFPSIPCIGNFVYIRKLHLKLTSYIELRKVTTFLKFMESLELLSLHIDVNTDSMLSQPTSLPQVIRKSWVKVCPELNQPTSHMFDSIVMKESRSYRYASFNFLKNLKTIQLTLDIYNLSIGHHVLQPFKMNPPIIQKHKKLYDFEISSFLMKAPNKVENLYLRGLPRMKCSSTFTLSRSFLNLKFLCLGEILDMDRDCLKHFQRLKILVSYYKNNFDLPEDIESFMSCFNYFSTTKELGMGEEAFPNYEKYLNQFSKVCTVSGSIKGKVFFNHPQDFINIKRYFPDIEEMAFGR